MSKAARGTKRVCQHCSGKFYDLNRSPIVCPLCGEEFALAVTEEEKDKVLAPKKPEAKKPAPEKPKEKPPASDDDSKTDEDVDDELSDLEEGEDEEIAEDGGDETFLEQEDDDDGDVSGIIGAPIPKDEEES